MYMWGSVSPPRTKSTIAGVPSIATGIIHHIVSMDAIQLQYCYLVCRCGSTCTVQGDRLTDYHMSSLKTDNSFVMQDSYCMHSSWIVEVQVHAPMDGQPPTGCDSRQGKDVEQEGRWWCIRRERERELLTSSIFESRYRCWRQSDTAKEPRPLTTMHLSIVPHAHRD